MEETERTDLTEALGTLTLEDARTTWTGMYIQGTADQFWVVTCPCGVMAHYPLNGLPEVDARHPCGNPDHWTIRWSA